MFKYCSRQNILFSLHYCSKDFCHLLKNSQNISVIIDAILFSMTLIDLFHFFLFISLSIIPMLIVVVASNIRHVVYIMMYIKSVLFCLYIYVKACVKTNTLFWTSSKQFLTDWNAHIFICFNLWAEKNCIVQHKSRYVNTSITLHIFTHTNQLRKRTSLLYCLHKIVWSTLH